jgi:hypothetical protein
MGFSSTQQTYKEAYWWAVPCFNDTTRRWVKEESQEQANVATTTVVQQQPQIAPPLTPSATNMEVPTANMAMQVL